MAARDTSGSVSGRAGGAAGKVAGSIAARAMPMLCALALSACAPGPDAEPPALLDSGQIAALQAMTAAPGRAEGVALTDAPATAATPQPAALTARGTALRARAAALRGEQTTERDADTRLRSRADALRAEREATESPED